MRVYAKVKSERAEKGQGGNDFLEIAITVKGDIGKDEILTFSTLRIVPVGNGYALELQLPDRKEIKTYPVSIIRSGKSKGETL